MLGEAISIRFRGRRRGRLARAYERLTATDEALIYATMSRLMARRLARMES